MDNNNDQRLSDLNNAKEPTYINQGYSKFVKVMRWGLPIFALIMMVVVIAWPELDEQIEAIPKEDILDTQEIATGGNELLNPRYETTDSQNNPVNLRARKAIQSQNNKDVVRLETPEADFKTKQGDAINVKALQGTYDQAGEKLFLQDNVKITHEKNYVLDAQELRINIKTQEAFSGQDVTIISDDAQLNAMGLKGNMEAGTLFFNGPAKLTFNPKKNQATSTQNTEKIKKDNE